MMWSVMMMVVLLVGVGCADETVPRWFTRQELAKYTGEDGGPIYLAVKGRVYDVSRGRDHYGPKGSYRDASRAFADLCFTPECLKVAHIVDDSLPQATRDAIDHYADFYAKEKTPGGSQLKYPFIGIVINEQAEL